MNDFSDDEYWQFYKRFVFSLNFHFTNPFNKNLLLELRIRYKNGFMTWVTISSLYQIPSGKYNDRIKKNLDAFKIMY